MDAFREAWFAIDTKCAGRITPRQLINYMQRKNYDDAFIIKWIQLFDKDDSGIIEYKHFCEVLGLDVNEFWTELRLRVSGGGLPAGVELISGDMELSWQIKLSQLCLEGVRTNGSLKDVPKWVKTQADRQFNQLWHVVMVNGQFWCYYGHEPGYSFVFRYEKYIFIMWKTPVS